MKIIILDDDALVSMSLKMIIEAGSEIKIAAMGSDGGELLNLYEQYQPDLILLDIQMKQVSGLEAAAQLLSKYPNAKIIFLTTFIDDEYIIKALRLGAKGYILKQDYEGLIPALTAVMQGQSVFGQQIVSKLPTLMSKTSSSFSCQKYDLSEREFEIISLVAEGLSNKELSEKLCLSEGTIRNYLSVILEKLQLRDRTQLAVFYYKNRE